MARYGVHLKITGLDDIIRDLQDMVDHGPERAAVALDAALERTGETSRGLAHVHQGDLKGSISTASERVGDTWAGTVSSDARGAIFEVQRGGDHSAFIDELSALSEADFERSVDAYFASLRRRE